MRADREHRFFRRAYAGFGKLPVEAKYELECCTEKNGWQRLIYTKEAIPLQNHVIMDSKTGTHIISGLSGLSNGDFEAVCRFICRRVDLVEFQKELPRVSKLPLFTTGEN